MRENKIYIWKKLQEKYLDNFNLSQVKKKNFKPDVRLSQRFILYQEKILHKFSKINKMTMKYLIFSRINYNILDICLLTLNFIPFLIVIYVLVHIIIIKCVHC